MEFRRYTEGENEEHHQEPSLEKPVGEEGSVLF
jgi:hypothetical protein